MNIDKKYKECIVMITCITAAYEATLILELVRENYAVRSGLLSKKISVYNPDSGGAIVLLLTAEVEQHVDKFRDDLMKIMKDQRMKFHTFVVIPNWLDTRFYLNGFTLEENKPKTVYRD